jgi:hypothetical protein
MAYFDNPANNESWEQAMVGLRAERARRLSGEESAEVKSLRAAKDRAYGPFERIPVTLSQVEAEYQAERGAKTPGRRLEKESPALKGPEINAPEKSGPELKKTIPVG